SRERAERRKREVTPGRPDGTISQAGGRCELESHRWGLRLASAGVRPAPAASGLGGPADTEGSANGPASRVDRLGLAPCRQVGLARVVASRVAMEITALLAVAAHGSKLTRVAERGTQPTISVLEEWDAGPHRGNVSKFRQKSDSHA